jgi:hypothetical protein
MCLKRRALNKPIEHDFKNKDKSESSMLNSTAHSSNARTQSSLLNEDKVAENEEII